MYKVLKHTCRAIVLPIGSIVSPDSRCRSRRGLLKVPLIYQAFASPKTFTLTGVDFVGPLFIRGNSTTENDNSKCYI